MKSTLNTTKAERDGRRAAIRDRVQKTRTENPYDKRGKDLAAAWSRGYANEASK